MSCSALSKWESQVIRFEKDTLHRREQDVLIRLIKQEEGKAIRSTIGYQMEDFPAYLKAKELAKETFVNIKRTVLEAIAQAKASRIPALTRIWDHLEFPIKLFCQEMSLSVLIRPLQDNLRGATPDTSNEHVIHELFFFLFDPKYPRSW